MPQENEPLSYDELLAQLADACKEQVYAATIRLDENDSDDLTVKSDAEEVGRVLARIVRGNSTFVSSRARHRQMLHYCFGAPGDWGYDHPIGKALAKLYSVKLED